MGRILIAINNYRELAPTALSLRRNSGRATLWALEKASAVV